MFIVTMKFAVNSLMQVSGDCRAIKKTCTAFISLAYQGQFVLH